jgi:hypothetical protein
MAADPPAPGRNASSPVVGCYFRPPEPAVRFAVERELRARVAFVGRLDRVALLVPPERGAAWVDERRVERVGVTTARSLSKSLSTLRLVFFASRRSACIALVTSL